MTLIACTRPLARAGLILLLAAGAGCTSTHHEAPLDGGGHDVTVGPLAITTTTLPGAQAHVHYSATLDGTGGLRPYAWSVSVGTLPSGLALDPATGVLAGVPDAAGSATFTVAVTDQLAATATQAYTLTIDVAPTALSVTTTTLPNGQVGVAYDQTVAVSGGKTPYAFTPNCTTQPCLPPGLALDGTTGAIQGAPTAAGDFTFQILVFDSSSPSQHANATLSMHVTLPPPVVLSTASLPDGQVTASYSAILAATGGLPPYHWQVSVGALPAGLALDATTGEIAGTPTAAGVASFTIRVFDSFLTPGRAEKPFTITVAAPPPPLTVTTTSLPGGTVGAAYSATLAATGGITPSAWSVTAGTLPDGLSLDAASGAITGSPTTEGTADLTFQVTDSAATSASATAQLSIVITRPALTVTTTSLPDGVSGVAYSVTLQASGGTTPYTWGLATGTPPTGIELHSDGTLSGSSTVVGTATFTVQVTDTTTPTAQTTTAQLSVTINPPGLAVTTSSLPGGTVGTAYSASVQASGGTPTYSWSVTTGNLPDGVTLAAGGALSGTPTAAGTFTFTVQVLDSGTPTPQTATRQLTITIAPATLVVTTTTLAAGTTGAAYTDTLLASGGTPTFTWIVIQGAPPDGLTVNADGSITGTPTATGTFTFTVQVTDSGTPTPQTATKQLSITIS